MYIALPPVLHVKASPVAGQGLFAKEDIPADFSLGMTHIVICDIIHRTPLGGFYNHSDNPNVQRMVTNVLQKLKFGDL